MMDKMKGNMKYHKPYIFSAIVLSALFVAAPAYAATGVKSAGEGFIGVLSAIFLIAALGFGLGAFGFVADNIFHKRVGLSHQVLRIKPGLSFLIGIIITLVTLGLLALFQKVGFIALIILLAYLVGLALFAIGAITRLAAHIIEPSLLSGDEPGVWAYIKGGWILLAMNVIFPIGMIFFAGIFLAGVGATLLGYFASMGGAVSHSVQPLKFSSDPNYRNKLGSEEK